MWDTGKELNKVIIGFLRQLLGVNKKTTNIGVLAETGKYPIAIKIFDQIIRYWLRLNDSDNMLLKETRELNNKLYNKNKLCWQKTATFIAKAANIDIKDVTLRRSVKQNLKKSFDFWWKSQANPTGVNKLDFYYQHKKTFAYETYLDNIPR